MTPHDVHLTGSPSLVLFLTTVQIWLDRATDDEVLALDDLVLKERQRRGLAFEGKELDPSRPS